MSINCNITIAAIVPIYNTEEYLSDCLDSLVKQTDGFEEIILIDDGSEDNSIEIIYQFQNLYSNVKVYRQKNRGVSAARNRGIAACKSEYIMFVDSDDILKLDTVSTLKRQLINVKYDMVIFDAEILCENGFERERNPYDRSMYIQRGAMPGKQFLYRMFPNCYIVTAWQAVYSKQLIDINSFKFPLGISYTEDTLFFLETLLKAKNIYYIPQKTYIRRYRKNSATMAGYNEKKAKDSFWVSDIISQKVCHYISESEEDNDRLIALVLLHYNVALKMNLKLKDFNRYFSSSFYLFLNRNIHIIKKGNSITNVQMAIKFLDFISGGEGHKREINAYKIDMEKTLRTVVKKRLLNLPLQEENSITAIYGIGNAARAIIYLYEKLVGYIKCNLIFVDSYAENGKSYLGYPVFNVKEVPLEVENVIISSYRYREKMKEEIKSSIKRCNVIDLYENDFFEVDWEYLLLEF